MISKTNGHCSLPRKFESSRTFKYAFNPRSSEYLQFDLVHSGVISRSEWVSGLPFGTKNKTKQGFWGWRQKCKQRRKGLRHHYNLLICFVKQQTTRAKGESLRMKVRTEIETTATVE